MSIAFDETLRAIFFLSGRNQDWLAGISQDDEGIHLAYRFRYYAEDEPNNDAHSGKDSKSWQYMRGKPDHSLDDMIGNVQAIMTKLQQMDYVPPDGIACTLIRGSMTLEQFLEEFYKLPFVHKKEMSKEEFEREQGKASSTGP